MSLEDDDWAMKMRSERRGACDRCDTMVAVARVWALGPRVTFLDTQATQGEHSDRQTCRARRLLRHPPLAKHMRWQRQKDMKNTNEVGTDMSQIGRHKKGAKKGADEVARSSVSLSETPPNCRWPQVEQLGLGHRRRVRLCRTVLHRQQRCKDPSRETCHLVVSGSAFFGARPHLQVAKRKRG